MAATAASGIDLTTEDLEPLNEIQFPGTKQPGPQTRWRLAMKGKLIPGTDQRVVLETVKICSTRMTSVEAIHRFIRATNPCAAAPGMTESQRRGQHEAATACLEAAGVI